MGYAKNPHPFEVYIGSHTGLSLFWLNVDDARYYGTSSIDPHNILNKVNADLMYVNKEGIDNYGTISFKGISDIVPTVLTFDHYTTLNWTDDRPVLSKDTNDLATIQNVKDLQTGGVAVIFAYFTAFLLPGTSTSFPLISFSKFALGSDPYDSTINITDTFITVAQSGWYEATAVIRYNGASGSQVAGIKMYKNYVPGQNDSDAHSNLNTVVGGNEPDTGEQEYINVINVIVHLAAASGSDPADTLSVGYISASGNVSCTLTLKLIVATA